MKIVVEGCAHGELEIIYDTIKLLEDKESIKIDLLICCGDFQSTRNEADLRCMAVPPKYYNMCSFYKYYTGEKVAPILTIFIGGNHEASNYLQELPYGGWVAPNIYYLGYAGVINIAGVRIGGISGIYKSQDYMKGRFEKSPYNDSTKRSVYHIRNVDVFRLKQLSNELDIFLSHDWPSGIWEHGNKNQLIKFKPFFKTDMETGKLGSPPGEELLNHLKPKYWFAAHLHCKFAAVVNHNDQQKTKFLALDKCLPRRRFLQVFDLPHDENRPIDISYDLEWLTILFLTNHLVNVKNSYNYMPGVGQNQRFEFTPTKEEKTNILHKFHNDLRVPLNFVKTVEGFNLDSPKEKFITQPKPQSNSQTVNFCKILGIDDPMALLTDLTDGESVEENKTEEIKENRLETENSAPEIPVRKLNLPEPKMESSVELIEVSNLSILSKGSLEEYKTNTSFETNDIDGEIVNNINNVEDTQTDTPIKKKFKRRNAEIYESESA